LGEKFMKKQNPKDRALPKDEKKVVVATTEFAVNWTPPQNPTLQVAPAPTWSRYIDSRMRQFGTR
jgi:hypothetical protein